MNLVDLPDNQLHIVRPIKSPQFEVQLNGFDATEFANTCKVLLNQLNSFEYLPENFRFEVRVEEMKPKLILLIDPCFWYRYVLNKDTRTEIARTWVNSIREQKIQHVMKNDFIDPEQGNWIIGLLNISTNHSCSEVL